MKDFEKPIGFEKFYSIKEAAEMINKSPAHVRLLARTGAIGATKPANGGSWLIPESSILEFCRMIKG